MKSLPIRPKTSTNFFELYGASIVPYLSGLPLKLSNGLFMDQINTAARIHSKKNTLSVSTKIDLPEVGWVDSFDFVNEIEVRIRGDDLLYSVMDHGGGMKGISRLNFGIRLQEFNGE